MPPGRGELVSGRAHDAAGGHGPFVYRYYPTVREARARARAGSLGELRLLHGGYLQDWLLAPSDDNWRVDAELGGPSRAFADIGSHWCDLIEFVSGQRIVALAARTAVAHPERMRTEGRSFSRGDGDGAPRAVKTEDIATLMFETDAGIVGSTVISPGLGRTQEPPLVRAQRHRGRRWRSTRSGRRRSGSAGARAPSGSRATSRPSPPRRPPT